MKRLDNKQFIRTPKEALDELHALPPNPPGIVHVHNQIQHTPEEWYNILHLDTLETTHHLPHGLLKHLIEIESQGNPTVVSRRGAKGLFQIMPASVSGFLGDPLNPIEAAEHAARTLRDLYSHFKSWGEALAAYNWGRGNVIRHGLENSPLETKNYIKHFKNRGINIAKQNSVNDVNIFDRVK